MRHFESDYEFFNAVKERWPKIADKIEDLKMNRVGNFFRREFDVDFNDWEFRETVNPRIFERLDMLDRSGKMEKWK